MEHADSKIMGRITEIENYVLGGFVLDDRGAWVSIADKKASEEDFLAHLEAGRVLHEGKWLKFEDKKKSSAHQQTEAPYTTPPVAPPVAPPVHQRENQVVPAMEEETAAGLYPPETKAIQIQSPVSEIEETTIDPASGYAPETGLFIIDHSQETAPFHPLYQELIKNLPETPPKTTRETKSLPALAPPSIPSWEQEESRHKKLTLIIVGIIVVVAGIAAVAAIMLQVSH